MMTHSAARIGEFSQGSIPASGHRAGEAFEWAVTAFSTSFVVGLYLDGWAHINELPESFFTPWHAVIYVSFLASACVITSSAVRGHRRSRPWSRSLPAGYGLSLVGVFIFMTAGIGDLCWHSAFGIEAGIAALYSPPHLLLAAGGILIATGPLRSAWQLPRATRASLWRAIVSVTLLLAILTFFVSESHPLIHPWSWQPLQPRALSSSELGLPALENGGLGVRDITATLGIIGIVLQSAVLISLILLTIRRWAEELPLGWLTLLLGSNACAAMILHSTYWAFIPGVSAGILGDVIYRWAKPRLSRQTTFRLFSAGLPGIYYGLYFATLSMTGGIWWPIHLSAGAVVLAAASALLVSYLVLPPAVPAPASHRGRCRAPGGRELGRSAVGGPHIVERDERHRRRTADRGTTYRRSSGCVRWSR
jgi:hypothetical protein